MGQVVKVIHPRLGTGKFLGDLVIVAFFCFFGFWVYHLQKNELIYHSILGLNDYDEILLKVPSQWFLSPLKLTNKKESVVILDEHKAPILKFPVNGSRFLSLQREHLFITLKWERIDASAQLDLDLRRLDDQEFDVHPVLFPEGATVALPDGHYVWRLRLRGPKYSWTPFREFVIFENSHGIAPRWIEIPNVQFDGNSLKMMEKLQKVDRQVSNLSQGAENLGDQISEDYSDTYLKIDQLSTEEASENSLALSSKDQIDGKTDQSVFESNKDHEDKKNILENSFKQSASEEKSELNLNQKKESDKEIEKEIDKQGVIKLKGIQVSKSNKTLKKPLNYSLADKVLKGAALEIQKNAMETLKRIRLRKIQN